MIVKATETPLLTQMVDQEFVEKFNRRPFMIGHELCDHPLFQLERLMELSQRLPEASVEYNAGDLPVSQDPTRTPRNGLSIPETIARIRENKSWLVLKNVEQDDQYGTLLNRCLDQMETITRQIAPGMKKREGFIFISSPESITPYHIDPEKQLFVADSR